jgi:Lar family restriction alleviation protein
MRIIHNEKVPNPNPNFIPPPSRLPPAPDIPMPEVKPISELKPCPFCGGKNIESRTCDYGTKVMGRPYIVGCRDCKISTSIHPQEARLLGFRSAKEAAETIWNRRRSSHEY